MWSYICIHSLCITQGLETSTMATTVCVTTPGSPLKMIETHSLFHSLTDLSLINGPSFMRLLRQSWKLKGGTVGIHGERGGIFVLNSM